MGRRLKKLSAGNQVLCTLTTGWKSWRRRGAVIEELDVEGRTREVGRILSDQTLTPEALKHAEQPIKMSV